MVKSIFDQEVEDIFLAAQRADLERANPQRQPIFVGDLEIKPPFPSPTDWRDYWIYMLMIDRFNNPDRKPNSPWNQKYDYRQGGTFHGVTEKLDYIKALGARAIWITPVLKNPISNRLKYNYHGYSTQDFLTIDERFASDGTLKTAEKELRQLVDTAHEKGLHVILDVVINHAGRVFDYFDESLENRLGDEIGDCVLANKALKIKWASWKRETEFPSYLTDQELLLKSALNSDQDDAILPTDLRQKIFFRRCGKLPDKEDIDFPGDFQKGDLGTGMRQFLLGQEYSLYVKEEHRENDSTIIDIFRKYGDNPILNILIRIYQYLIAKYDFDGFRIDTTKHVDPMEVETFGNAVREFALSIGKKNFFTFGEISTGSDTTLAYFVGRNLGTKKQGFGIDSAVDYPLFYRLKDVVKGFDCVENFYRLFSDRKKEEENLLSSHGEASQFFVTFIDNHDLDARFYQPDNKSIESLAMALHQMTLALGLLFCLPGIPCLYYGTEQALKGTVDDQGNSTLGSWESVREALWGKENAFNPSNTYQEIQKLASLRSQNPALRYGRYYFREISGNGIDFGLSYGVGGIIAFSRILNTQEILIVANTANEETKKMNKGDIFIGYVIVALEIYSRLHEQGAKQQMKLIYSNRTYERAGEEVEIEIKEGINFTQANNLATRSAMIPIKLDLMEIQIWKLA